MEKVNQWTSGGVAKGKKKNGGKRGKDQESSKTHDCIDVRNCKQLKKGGTKTPEYKSGDLS